MTDSERLREALLEIETLREKERKSHAETVALLHCVEAFATASSPAEAVCALIMSVRETIGAERLLVVTRSKEMDAKVFRTGDGVQAGTQFSLPVDIFKKQRTVRDVCQSNEDGLTLDGSTYRSLVCCPFKSTSELVVLSVIGLHSDVGSFDRSDQKLLKKLSGLFGTAIETEKIATEKVLFAEVISNSSTGFAISDATQSDQPLIYVNQAFEDLTGYSADDVIGKNCRFLSAEDRDSEARKRLRQVVLDGSSGRFVVQNKKKNGELFWNDLTLSSVCGPDGTVWNTVATQTDATVRINAEQARDAARGRMAQVLETTKDAFLLLDAEKKVMFCNKAWRQAFPCFSNDWSPGSDYFESWGEFSEALRLHVGRDDDSEIPDLETALKSRDGIELQIQNGRTYLVNALAGSDEMIVLSATNITPLKRAEAILRRRAIAIETAIDGIAVVNAAGRLIDLNTSAANLFGFDRPAMALGRRLEHVYEMDEPTCVKSGQYNRKGELAHRFLHEIMFSPVDDGGHVLVVRNITERIENEKRRAEMTSALAHAKRQQAVGQMAAGFAHDFNNLLSAINGSSTLISMNQDIATGIRVHADRITAAGLRAARMVNRLLDLGSGEKTGSGFDLSSALNDIADVLEPSVPGNVELVIAYPETLLLVLGDPDAAHQMVMNLILNAIDAIGNARGTVEVKFGTVEVPDAKSLDVGLLSSGTSYAAVAVSDDGSGIAPSIRDALFQPYFSTKGSKGTGLGLATAAVQIAEIGGGIDVKSELGHGTTVTLYWPLISVKGAPHSASKNVSTGSLEGATILVVDDDFEVGSVLCAFLEQLGAEVALCDAPELAAEAIEEDPDAWTLLITDYDMPGMTGGDLIERVGPIAPTLPVVLVTALARRLTDRRLNRPQVLRIFAKPIDLSELAETISKHL